MAGFAIAARFHDDDFAVERAEINFAVRRNGRRVEAARGVEAFLFPADSRKVLYVGAQLGVGLYMFLVGLTFVLGRTPFGRHIYAVGGNAEAARRAGISVKGIKTLCFMIGSTLAAVAGVLIASRDNSVSPTTGGAQTLLFAVGAAVIGGTSLFGGKGRIIDAVIGGLAKGPFYNLTVYTEVLQDTMLDLFDSGKLDAASSCSLSLSASPGFPKSAWANCCNSRTARWALP